MSDKQAETKTKTINIEDMTPLQSLDALYNMVNVAASKGAFNIDESYVLKVLFSKVLSELKKSNVTNVTQSVEKSSVVEQDV